MVVIEMRDGDVFERKGEGSDVVGGHGNIAGGDDDVVECV